MEVTTVDYMWVKSGLTVSGSVSEASALEALTFYIPFWYETYGWYELPIPRLVYSKIFGKAATGCIDNLTEG